MQSQEFVYKHGDNGEPLLANVHWSATSSFDSETSKPIFVILHGGGFVVGGSSMIPKPQISYLTSLNFVVVVPNYRLAPQVSAKEGAFADSLSAMTWSTTTLPVMLKESYKILVDAMRTAVMGHSAGATMALWLASRFSPLKAVIAFYPTLYAFEPENSIHKPYTGFGPLLEYEATAANENALYNRPSGIQLSSFPLALPGMPLPPRSQWQMAHLKHGTLWKAVEPEGDYKAIDPCVHFTEKGRTWPPTMFVQGSDDDVPGSGLVFVERAVADLKKAGAKSVEVVSSEGQKHMFDMAPDAAPDNASLKGQAVKRGLDFLRSNV